MTTSDHATIRFDTAADHPALELLNTLPRVDGALAERLNTDEDVVAFLAEHGWPLEKGLKALKPGALRQSAIKLREIVRTLIERRAAGKSLDLATLNDWLCESRSHLELTRGKSGKLRLTRRWKQRTPEEALAPVAESAAALLAEESFHLVRRCESADCVLWFYDRTKAHRRRWCSMAACGNRHKVAAFRARQQEHAET